ncbi:hypothetical protein CTAYLR_005098 [Chrysophaeum taylorii]|uniref:Glutamate--cysteine ligase n=1 Tax=Chrysophaeum taylorii TaxID=2483200 RepID=A0AAD7UES1_9STRA|nr:hypothetical protein CTAYLR_005098 [Chrysophaeum taylorii]
MVFVGVVRGFVQQHPQVQQQEMKRIVVANRAILTVGSPMSWGESLDHLAYVREHGVLQFIKVWENCCSMRRTDELLWGDEVEYGLLRVSESKAWVSLRGPEVREALEAAEGEHAHRSEGCLWHPEYGAWMIEGTPSRPYSGYAADLCRVERNMRLRRKRLLSFLEDDEICPTIVNFAGFGVGDFCWPPSSSTSSDNKVTHSPSVPDRAINPHPRFAALTANIRARRGGENVDARPPRFFDAKTPTNAPESIEGLDAMAYGMGCCCLQVTFQARDAREARYAYDQLAALAPVMLALTAGAPVWRGVLADTDARWDVVSASVDDRTPAERGTGVFPLDPRMAGGGNTPLPRSRYSSISRYAFECEDEGQVAQFCDVEAPIDSEAFDVLRGAGVDPALARHVAGLFARDPLVVFEGKVTQVDDDVSSDHFDNIQSTNWNTVRLKPPPPTATNATGPGWRTEFRPMEVQLTDFENAAFAVFAVLVTRVILAFDLNLYVPLSRIDANMRRAMRRDAAIKAKFFFRRQMDADQVADGFADERFDACCAPPDPDAPAVYEEMTAAEIIDGKGDYFPGLAPLAYAYLDYIGCDRDSLAQISTYVEHVRERANGKRPTPAKWIRDFIKAHPDYAHDGIVSEKIARDIAVAAHEIGVGARPAPELLGDDVVVRPITPDGAWDSREVHVAVVMLFA